VTAAPQPYALVYLPDAINFGAAVSKTSSGTPLTPVLPLSGGTVTLRGEIVNAGGVTLPKGLPMSIWAVDVLTGINWGYQACTLPADPVLNTTTLAKAIKPGSRGTFEISAPAGKLPLTPWNALVIVDPNCARPGGMCRAAGRGRGRWARAAAGGCARGAGGRVAPAGCRARVLKIDGPAVRGSQGALAPTRRAAPPPPAGLHRYRAHQRLLGPSRLHLPRR
jgi:hypothetical protein